MNWESLREHWQRTATTPLPVSIVEDTLRRAKRVHSRILLRDGIESVVALALVPFAVGWLLAAIHTHAVVLTMSCVLMVAWLLYVPWRLWRTRRQLPHHDAGLPLQRYLELERQAMLAQAHMLKSVAWWYIMPLLVSVTGQTLGASGPTLGVFAYLAAVLVLCVLIVRRNRRAARHILRHRIPDIDARCRELEALAAASADAHTDYPTQKDNGHDL